MTAPSASPLLSYSTRTPLPVLRSHALKRCVEVAMLHQSEPDSTSAAARRCRCSPWRLELSLGKGLGACLRLLPPWYLGVVGHGNFKPSVAPLFIGVIFPGPSRSLPLDFLLLPPSHSRTPQDSAAAARIVVPCKSRPGACLLGPFTSPRVVCCYVRPAHRMCPGLASSFKIVVQPSSPLPE